MKKRKMKLSPEELEQLEANQKLALEYSRIREVTKNYQCLMENRFAKDKEEDEEITNDVLYSACLRIAAQLAQRGSKGVKWFQYQAKLVWMDTVEGPKPPPPPFKKFRLPDDGVKESLPAARRRYRVR